MTRRNELRTHSENLEADRVIEELEQRLVVLERELRVQRKMVAVKQARITSLAKDNELLYLRCSP